MSLGVNIAIVQDGKILLTQREDFEVWVLPGGGVEAGETLAQAAVREASEETGLQVELTRLVGFYSRPGPMPWSGTVALFAARPLAGELRPQPEEVAAQDWFDPGALPDLHVPWLPRRIADVFAGVGGSPAWRTARRWLFEASLTRSELYQRRDLSGLSRVEFYQRFLNQAAMPDTQELPFSYLPTGPAANERQAPLFAVNVAVIQNGEILLTQREDFEVWCLPGGEVNAGESIADAARREVAEETGLQVKLERLAGVYSDPELFGRGAHVAVFTAVSSGGEMQPDPKEVLEARFFAFSEIPAVLQFGTHRRIQDVLAGAGGSAVWTQSMPSLPFAQLSRQQAYALRDQSGLSRGEFFRRQLEQSAPLVEFCELSSCYNRTNGPEETL